MLRFSSGIVLVFNSEMLVFPLLHSIVSALPEEGLVGFINLWEILQETFPGEEPLNTLTVCKEILLKPFDLTDAEERSRTLFQLTKAVIKLEFDDLVAPYCRYRREVLESDTWRSYSPALNLPATNNIRYTRQ